MFYANENWKKAELAILISDKIDFKTKTVLKEKEGYYITIKGSIQPNIGAPKYIKQILTDLKGEIDSNTIIVGNLIPHLPQWINHSEEN